MLRRKRSHGLMVLISFVLIVTLSGCAALSDWFQTAKGNLIGNAYTIYQYDNHGNKTLTLQGDHIAISPFEPTYDAEGKQELTSVLDITIDGHQVLGVGNTLIFEQKGINKMAGFDEISEFANIYSNSGIRFIPFDKFINDLQNLMGKSRMVLVYSQLGQPIGIYQGDEIFVTVPDNLPKMTRLNIDGKSLYLHRVNYTILDKALMN